MWRYYYIYIVLNVILDFISGQGIKNFDDTVLFQINWPEKSDTQPLDTPNNVEFYPITSANNEQYVCSIPDTIEQDHNNAQVSKGANPIEMLSILFIQKTCSYRLESYWTYELCHGRFVRQYHEDREGKKVKTQEYYLGTFDISQKFKLSVEYDKMIKKSDIPVKNIDGINMPYVEIKMEDGTLCDLNNKPRMIRVLYVCYHLGKNEIFSLKETSSCEYEAIILTPFLCFHPDYEPQDSKENKIECRPVDSTPQKPRALVAMETESAKLRNQKVADKLQKIYAIFHVDKEGQEGDGRVRVEIRSVDIVDKHNGAEDSVNLLIDQNVTPAESNSVQSFLSGKNCLHGGNGWWKYEFCFGRSIVQYHIEKDGSKTIVSLGKFNKEKHLEWIAAHPNKKPEPQETRKHLSHFYSDGSICDKTGQLRQTEVKLKCVENRMGSPSSISLFLLEPKTCKYVLKVESPLICDILEYADENGLLSEKFEADFSKLKITALHIEQEDDLDERIANGDD